MEKPIRELWITARVKEELPSSVSPCLRVHSDRLHYNSGKNTIKRVKSTWPSYTLSIVLVSWQGPMPNSHYEKAFSV